MNHRELQKNEKELLQMNNEKQVQLIEDLQVKVSFIEDMYEKLSEEFYQQQGEVAKLQLLNQQLLEKLKSIESQYDSNQMSVTAGEKPPHY